LKSGTKTPGFVERGIRYDTVLMKTSDTPYNPSAFARALYWLSGRLRCRIINGNNGEPYLERYALLRLPGGRSLYLHRFLDSDPDRGLHNHPWTAALGLVLSGGYKELRLDKQAGNRVVVERMLQPGAFNRIAGDDFHRIVLPEGHEAWTLFMHTPKVKDWGFLTFGPDGDQVYKDHDEVANEGSHERWWRTAPRGRAQKRAPLHG